MSNSQAAMRALVSVSRGGTKQRFSGHFIGSLWEWPLRWGRKAHNLIRQHYNELLATIDTLYALGGHLDGFAADSDVYCLFGPTVRTSNDSLLRLHIEDFNFYVSGH
jgi:hypothetical protein